MTPRLSVLIATIPERKSQLRKLLVHITKMCKPFPGMVEILTNDAAKSEMSIGAKRQAMIEQASGDYVCFVDDDDWVSDSYIADILKATESGPDCIGFRIEVHGLARRTQMASASMRCEWAKNVDGFDYVRSIYHKTPVKREHALAIGFADMRFAEDADYSDRLAKSGLLQREEYIDKALYIYRYKFQPISRKFGIK